MFFNPIIGEDTIRTKVSDFYRVGSTKLEFEVLTGNFVACFQNTNLKPKVIEVTDYYDEDTDFYDDNRYFEDLTHYLDSLRYGGANWLAFDITSNDDHYTQWMQWLAFQLCMAYDKASSFILATSLIDFETDEQTSLDLLGLTFVKEVDCKAFYAQHVGQDYTNHPIHGFDLWKRNQGVSHQVD